MKASTKNLSKIKYYYRLTKPGIIRGNTLAVLAGFFLASQGEIDEKLMLWTVVGSALIMAGGCVLNNYIDRDIDKLMTRTSDRPVASGKISSLSAIIYGGLLTFLGFVILYNFTNNLTVYVGLVGFIFYVYIYAYFKRSTEHGTLIGSISGAVPPLAGYTAVSNSLDTGAILVFLILVFWQMPHFYAIAIFRAKEYAKASIPVLSLTRGVNVAKRYIVTYIPLYMVVSLLPVYYGLVGEIYLISMTIVGIYWLNVATTNFYMANSDQWARKVFGVSLLVLLVFCISVFIDTTLV
jgi:heme o synthase